MVFAKVSSQLTDVDDMTFAKVSSELKDVDDMTFAKVAPKFVPEGWGVVRYSSQ